MAYNETINGTDRIKISRPQIEENFTQIMNWTGVDHATFGTPNEGAHNQVTFPLFNAAGPVGGQMKMWSNTYAPSGTQEIFIGNGNTGVNWPFTNSLANQNGYTFLPGGILMKWGIDPQNVMTGGPFNFVFDATVPFTAIYYANAVVAATNNPGQDVNAVAYITDFVTVANQVSYRIWRRNLFNVAGTDHPPYTVFLFALGAP